MCALPIFERTDAGHDVTCGTVRSHPALLPSPLPRLRTRAMLTDLTLAYLHHLLVFGLVSMLVAQAELLRGRMDGTVLAKLGGIDRGYGITALSLRVVRSEEHTSELQSLMRLSYAVF